MAAANNQMGPSRYVGTYCDFRSIWRHLEVSFPCIFASSHCRFGRVFCQPSIDINWLVWCQTILALLPTNNLLSTPAFRRMMPFFFC